MAGEVLSAIIDEASELLRGHPDVFKARDVNDHWGEVVTGIDTHRGRAMLSLNICRGCSEQGPYLEGNVYIREATVTVGEISSWGHRTTISTQKPGGFIDFFDGFSRHNTPFGPLFLSSMAAETREITDNEALAMLSEGNNRLRLPSPRYLKFPSYVDVKDEMEQEGKALGDLGIFF